MRFYRALFGFGPRHHFVIYGVGLPSECFWIVPGDHE